MKEMKDFDVDDHISSCNNGCDKRNDRSPNGGGPIHKFKACVCLLDQCSQHLISFVILFQINRNAHKLLIYRA
jgi:hypothetical protein